MSFNIVVIMNVVFVFIFLFIAISFHRRSKQLVPKDKDPLVTIKADISELIILPVIPVIILPFNIMSSIMADMKVVIDGKAVEWYVVGIPFLTFLSIFGFMLYCCFTTANICFYDDELELVPCLGKKRMFKYADLSVEAGIHNLKGSKYRFIRLRKIGDTGFFSKFKSIVDPSLLYVSFYSEGIKSPKPSADFNKACDILFSNIKSVRYSKDWDKRIKDG